MYNNRNAYVIERKLNCAIRLWRPMILCKEMLAQLSAYDKFALVFRIGKCLCTSVSWNMEAGVLAQILHNADKRKEIDTEIEL